MANRNTERFVMKHTEKGWPLKWFNNLSDEDYILVSTVPLKTKDLLADSNPVIKEYLEMRKEYFVTVTKTARVLITPERIEMLNKVLKSEKDDDLKLSFTTKEGTVTGSYSKTEVYITIKTKQGMKRIALSKLDSVI